MTTPSQPTELDKAVALHIIQRLRAKHLILERFQEEEIKEVVEAELSVAAKRAQALEKKRDEMARKRSEIITKWNFALEEIQLLTGGLEIAKEQRGDLELQLSQLRTEYKKALEALELDSRPRYRVGEENTLYKLKQKILSTPLAIETLKKGSNEW